MSLLFLVGCIGARIFLAKLAPKLSPLLFCIAMGFLIIYAGGYRKTGIETGGKAIWWNHLRPIHGALYLVAALVPYWSSVVILIDTVIGLFAYLHHNSFLNIINTA